MNTYLTFNHICPGAYIRITADSFETAESYIWTQFHSEWSELAGKTWFDPKDFPIGELLHINLEANMKPKTDPRLEALSDKVRCGIPVSTPEALEVIAYQYDLARERQNRKLLPRIARFFRRFTAS